MAKKKTATNIRQIKQKLRDEGPSRVYLLWGEEGYLVEDFYNTVKSAVIGDAPEEFSVHRFDGVPDIGALSDAVDTMPFMSKRTLVISRGFDINKCREGAQKQLNALLGNLPDTCTLVFIPGSGFSPDGRLTLNKTIKKHGEIIEFTLQEQNALLSWIRRRVQAAGLDIDAETAAHLIFTCGAGMYNLISEIDKLTAYSAEYIKKSDIDEVCIKTVEAQVFDMTESLALFNYDKALRQLGALLKKREEPIMILSVIGRQMRQMLAARTVLDAKKGKRYLMDILSIRYDFIADKLLNSVKAYERTGLCHAVRLCADTDKKLKSTGRDSSELLCELLLRLSLETRNGRAQSY